MHGQDYFFETHRIRNFHWIPVTKFSLPRQKNVCVPTIIAGSKVNLPGFGSFEARFRAGRQGRNPRTGEPLMIEDTHVPAFTAAKALKDSVCANAER